MTAWRLLAGPSTSAPTTELATARGRKLSAKLAEPSTLDFTIDGRHDQALDLLELATDVHLMRDGGVVFSGRLMPGRDEFDNTRHTVTVQARDLRGLLARRVLTTDLALSEVDVTVAVQQLWARAQTDPLGRTPNPADLGVSTTTLASTGVAVTRSCKKGSSVLAELQALSGGTSTSVFDWDVTPGWQNRTAQVWVPGRGSDKTDDVVLDYTYEVDRNGALIQRSSPVKKVSKETPTDAFANSLVLSGGIKTIKVAVPSVKTSVAVKTADKTTPAASTTQLNVQRGTRKVRSTTSNDTAPETETVTEITYEYIDVQIPTTPVQVADGSTVWNIGIWATAEEDTSIVEQSELQARATARLQELELLTPTYTVDLVRGFWQGPDHIWLGDTVRLILRSGRVQEDVSLRVTGVDVTVGDDGSEDVSLTVGATGKQLMATLLEQQRSIARTARAVADVQ